MAKKKNKDGLIPGQLVDEKTYKEIINKQRLEKQKAVKDEKVRKDDKPQVSLVEGAAE